MYVTYVLTLNKCFDFTYILLCLIQLYPCIMYNILHFHGRNYNGKIHGRGRKYGAGCPKEVNSWLKVVIGTLLSVKSIIMNYVVYF